MNSNVRNGRTESQAQNLGYVVHKPEANKNSAFAKEQRLNRQEAEAVKAVKVFADDIEVERECSDLSSGDME